MCIYDLSTREAETDGSQELAGQPVCPNHKLQVQQGTLFRKQGREQLWKALDFSTWFARHSHVCACREIETYRENVHENN